MKAKVFYLLFTLLFVSCENRVFGPGSQDFSKNLQNDYILVRSSSHNIKIVPKSSYNDRIPIIPTKILKLNVYKEYIIAYRQGLKRRSPNNPEDSYMIPNQNEFDYWILNTATPFVFKNLNELEFKRVSDSLKIPKKIKLINVYEF